MGNRSHEVPEWRQLFEEGLSGEPPDSHSVVAGQPVDEPEEKTPDDMKVSSEAEATDLPFIAERSMRPNTNKQANWQAQFFFYTIAPEIRIAKSVSSPRLPELRAGTAPKREETVFSKRR